MTGNLWHDDPDRDARHFGAERKFYRFVLAMSFILMMLAGVAVGLGYYNYSRCGTVTACPVGWDIAL